MKTLNSLLYLSTVVLLFESLPSSYAMQTSNKRNRADATTWAQNVGSDSKFELLRSLPPAIFKSMLGDLGEQGQTCAGVTCKGLREQEDRYRTHAKKDEIVVPADKQYRKLNSFIKYLYKYSRVKFPVIPNSSRHSAGDSKSAGSGSDFKTKDIGSLVTKINLGQLRPVPPSRPDSPPDASVEDVLKAIQTIFPDLQELRLANADLQESDLAIIGQMKNLRVLDLGGTSFYHGGIQHLSNLTEMRRLNLSAPGAAPSNFNPAAQFSHLSKMHHLVYLDFTQTPQNARAFQEWILSITHDNNAFAIYRRALMHEYGTDDDKGPPVDSKLAIASYEKAAHLGHPLAQTRLAKFYQKGSGVEKNPAQAYTWFKKARLQGHAEARTGYWESRFSRLTPQELALKHATLLRHPEPAKESPKEHFDYQSVLGWMYLNGLGVTQNVHQAVFWLRKAAEKGLAEAQHRLAFMYDSGRGVSQDYSQAVEWYRKAAEQGLAQSQYNLGGMYKNGQGVDQNHVKATEWVRKAAEQGLVDAQYNLGFGYGVGPGLAPDYLRQVEWYRKAAEQGSADAQNALGILYTYGHGVSRDDARATEWYRKAAEQGLAQAQHVLGRIYQAGAGVDQDNVQAVEWFRKAAEQRFAKSQFYLGLMYENGHGVDPDREEAIRWYHLAADQGHEEARTRLNLLENANILGSL